MKGKATHYALCGDLRVMIGSRLGCKRCNLRRALAWQKKFPEKVNAKNRRYKIGNKEKVALVSRNSKLKINYGMTIEQYNVQLEAQGSVCAICHRYETKQHPDGTVWSLSVDHCHTTGAIRGLLCSACNVGLSNFQDSPSMLAKAIEYLGQTAWPDFS